MMRCYEQTGGESTCSLVSAGATIRSKTQASASTQALCRVPELPPLSHRRAEGVPKSRYFIAVFTAASLPSLQLLSDICALQSH